MSSQNYPHYQRARKTTLAAALVFISTLLFLAGCRGGAVETQGYVEGEYVYVASPLAGSLMKRSVNRGDSVRTGDELFQLEQQFELGALQEVKEKLASAVSKLEDLKKGKRPSEIASLEAKIEETEANLRFTKSEVDRLKELVERRAKSQRDVDQARANYDQMKAALQSLKADLDTARLGAREDQIASAAADVQSLEGVLTQARWKVDQKTQKASADGIVADTFFETGEWVPAGTPVVSVLPPSNVKVRFFLPEDKLSNVHVGQAVSVSADSMKEPVECEISYVAPEAEFTPPVIFSKDSRKKLVFLIEAKLPKSSERELTTILKPGQPVDVHLRW